MLEYGWHVLVPWSLSRFEFYIKNLIFFLYKFVFNTKTIRLNDYNTNNQTSTPYQLNSKKLLK